MSSTEPIRPLKDVWLRPRRVFRELAATPVGLADYLLAALQGVATSVALYRTQMSGTHVGAADLLASSLMFGPIAGIISMFLFAAIYRRLGTRSGGAPAPRNQVVHVLAYGGIPVVASLFLWALTALIVGDAAVQPPSGEVDGFVMLVLRLQFAAYLLLTLWSVVLQVMGLSEIQGVLTRKAFGVWVLGQVLALLAVLFLSVLVAVLFPGLVSTR